MWTKIFVSADLAVRKKIYPIGFQNRDPAEQVGEDYYLPS